MNQGKEKSRHVANSYFASASRVDKNRRVFATTQEYYPFCCFAEKVYAESLTKAGIKWEYEPESFPVEIDGVIRHWTPDFYLPDKKMYVEVSWTRPDKLKRKKMEAFRREYPLLVLAEIERSDINDLLGV